MGGDRGVMKSVVAEVGVEAGCVVMMPVVEEEGVNVI